MLAISRASSYKSKSVTKVSIDRLNHDLPEEPKYGDIAWRVNTELFPHKIDSRKVFVDTTWLTFTSRMAGFGGIIVDDYMGDVSEHTADVTGIGNIFNDGTIAGGVSLSHAKAETEKSHLDRSKQKYPIEECNWPVLNIGLNRIEISEIIADKKHHFGGSNEELFAHELNLSIRQAMLEGAKDNLMRKNPLSKAVTLAHLNSLVALALIQHPAIALGLFTNMNLIPHVMLYSIYRYLPENFDEYGRRGKMLNNKRWSLFASSIQPDRLAVTAAALYSKPIVTAKPVEK